MSVKIFSNDVLNAFHKILDYIPILMEEPVAIYLTDMETYKIVRDVDEIPIKTEEGSKVDPNVLELIKKGEIYIGEYTSEKDGDKVTFKSYTIPIKGESGEVEGAVLLAKSIKRQLEVINASENIKASLEQITSAINDLNSNIQEVVEANGEILRIVQSTNEKTEDTNDILSFIEGISSQTNLLGLNAAIEAARAGEYGRGFDVVAKEIRKLSSSTSESIKKVDEVLKNITESISEINKRIEDSNAVFEVQASSLEEIAASIEELNSTAQIMHNLAENL